MEYADIYVVLYLDILKESTLLTIKSVLNQKINNEFKLLIFEDCKDNIILTTNNLYLRKKYEELCKDSHVIIKRGDAVGEANAYNYSIKHSYAPYITFIKTPIIYDDNRLQCLYDIMSNNDIDIYMTNIDDYLLPQTNELGVDDLLTYDKYNIYACIINKFKFDDCYCFFEPYWEQTYFYKFLLKSIWNNKRIFTDNSHNNIHTISNIFNNYNNLYYRFKNIFNKKNHNDIFTIIILFRNEGDEVEKTITSIKATTKNDIDILLIDDCSDDNYDYETISKIFNCKYHRNQERIGSVGNRNLGPTLIDTEYFMTLDGHMRFYDDEWDEYVTKLMLEHPNDILFASSSVITKDKSFVYNETGKGHKINAIGAALADFPKWRIMWQSKHFVKENKLVESSCILGACYIIKKSNWEKFDGIKFLKIYGLEEQMMSIKNFLYGGKNLCIKDLYVGHLYKTDKSQNTLSSIHNEISFNNLLFTYMFNENYLNEHINNIKETNNKQSYNKILSYLEESKSQINEYKKKLNKECIYTFNDYMKLNDNILYYNNDIKIYIISNESYSDIEFFTNNGYSVICIETNIEAYNKIFEKHKKQINHGNLTLLNKYENIVEKYGTPKLLRISCTNYIESALENNLPEYVCILSEFSTDNTQEEFETLNKLYNIGYRKFKLFGIEYNDIREIEKNTIWDNYNDIKENMIRNKQFKNNSKNMNKYYKYIWACK